MFSDPAARGGEKRLLVARSSQESSAPVMHRGGYGELHRLLNEHLKFIDVEKALQQKDGLRIEKK